MVSDFWIFYKAHLGTLKTKKPQVVSQVKQEIQVHINWKKC